jgi:hypothetical protein
MARKKNCAPPMLAAARNHTKELHLSFSEPTIEALYSQCRIYGHVTADASLAFVLLLQIQIYC